MIQLACLTQHHPRRRRRRSVWPSPGPVMGGARAASRRRGPPAGPGVWSSETRGRVTSQPRSPPGATRRAATRPSARRCPVYRLRWPAVAIGTSFFVVFDHARRSWRANSGSWTDAGTVGSAGGPVGTETVPADGREASIKGRLAARTAVDG